MGRPKKDESQLTEVQIARNAATKATREETKARNERAKAFFREAFAETEKNDAEMEKLKKKGREEGSSSPLSTSSLSPPELENSSDDELLLTIRPDRETETNRGNPKTKPKKPIVKVNVNAEAGPSSSRLVTTESKAPKKSSKTGFVFTSLLPDHLPASRPRPSWLDDDDDDDETDEIMIKPIRDSKKVGPKSKSTLVFKANPSRASDASMTESDIDNSPRRKLPARSSSSSLARTKASLKRARSKAELTDQTSSSESDEGSDYGQSKSASKAKGKKPAKETGSGAREGDLKTEMDKMGTKDPIRRPGRPKKVNPSTPNDKTNGDRPGPSTPKSTATKKTTARKNKSKKASSPGLPELPPLPPPSDYSSGGDEPVRSPSPATLRYRAQAKEFFEEISKKSLVVPERYIPMARASSELSSLLTDDDSDDEVCEDDEERRIVEANRDRDELCPICRQPLPMRPTPEFNVLHDKYRIRLPARESLASNFCALHQDLIRTVPLARHRGYPESVDFANLWEKLSEVRWIRRRMAMMCQDPRQSPIYQFHNLLICEVGKLRWGKMTRDMGMAELADPGYFGTVGGCIIEQYMDELFKWDYLSVKMIDSEGSPMTRKQFVRHVMVPECAIMLIMHQRSFWPPTSIDPASIPAPRVKDFGQGSEPAPELGTFKDLWQKANDVRKKSVEYGRYLSPNSEVEGETFRSFLMNRSFREGRTRELWAKDKGKQKTPKVKKARVHGTELGTEQDKTTEKGAKGTRHPEQRDIINISTSPEPDNAPGSSSQPIIPVPSPLSQTVPDQEAEPITAMELDPEVHPDAGPRPRSDSGPRVKNPSLVLSDWNLPLSQSTPCSSPGSARSGNTRTQKRKMRKTKSAGPDSSGLNEGREESEDDILKALDGIPDLCTAEEVDPTPNSNTNENGDADAQVGIDIDSQSAMMPSSSLQPPEDSQTDLDPLDAQRAEDENPTSRGTEPHESQDSFGIPELGSQDIKMFEEVVSDMRSKRKRSGSRDVGT